MMKRFCLIILLLILSVLAFSQEMKVVSFTLAERDMTAQNERVLDINDKPCALIKVETVETGLTFSVGTNEVVKVEPQGGSHPGEIWVYVPAGVTKITIQKTGYNVIRDYACPQMLQSGRTYVLKLTADKINVTIEKQITQQFVLFKVSPKQALVEFDGNLMQLTNGTASKLVPFGMYDYNVEAKYYHPEHGKINVSDPDNKTIVEINLKPAFGSLNVSGGNANGGTVFLDKTNIGTVPVRVDTVESGSHKLRIVKSLYKDYVADVNIEDGKPTNITPYLDANFSPVIFATENNAEIWINGEKRGSGRVRDNFEEGSYLVECKLANHKTVSDTYNITAGQSERTINLQSPIPINGSLSINSTPAMASVYVDGVLKGETPLLLSKFLIGRHNIRISSQGYADYETIVDVTEGAIANVEATLNNLLEVRFTCNVNNATLTIDGQKQSSANGTYSLTTGSHQVECKAEDYNDYKGTVNVGTSTGQQYKIEMIPSTPMHNGHEYVDLGLSVKWATCNIGATKPEDKGSYFAWGETAPKTDYRYSTYTYSSNSTTLPSNRDAASVNWGGSWRMPTRAEMNELINKCTWQWTTLNGMKGYRVTGTNGNSIFLPAAGLRDGAETLNVGSLGYYWSSSLSTLYSGDAWHLRFRSDYHSMRSDGRSDGFSVRPVRQ